jgi:hypothetical protein
MSDKEILDDSRKEQIIDRRIELLNDNQIEVVNEFYTFPCWYADKGVCFVELKKVNGVWQRK